MTNLGILGSTKGTDLQAIIDAIENKLLNAKISIAVSYTHLTLPTNREV